MESEQPKKSKNLSYNLVLLIGIGLLIIGFIVGGVVGNFIRLGSDFLSWVSIIMIIIQTFSKNVERRTKAIGWWLILAWIITMVIISAISHT
ncbi:MAG: hypothetical protein WC080_04680 [Patescibacteria group bacterium]